MRHAAPERSDKSLSILSHRSFVREFGEYLRQPRQSVGCNGGRMDMNPYLAPRKVRVSGRRRPIQASDNEIVVVPTHPIGIGPMLQDLQRRGLAPPSTGAFVEALRVMNEASHGVDVDSDAAEHAVSIGTAFLAELTDQNRDA